MKLKMCAALWLMTTAAFAGNNIDQAQSEVEAEAATEGWNVLWGEHIDHSSYGLCIAGYLVFDTNIIMSCVNTTLSPQILSLGAEAVELMAKHWGDVVRIEDLEYQGKIVSYKHWKKTSVGKISLPNTHQTYVLWRDVEGA